MSWSVGANGLPAEVKAAIKKQLEIPLQHLTGDEKKHCEHAAKLIDAVLDTQKNTHVQVNASGHASTESAGVETDVVKRQNLTISIQTFVPPGAVTAKPAKVA